MRYASRRLVILLAVLTLPSLAAAQDYEGRAELKGKVVNAEEQGLRDSMVTAVYNETGTGPEAVKVKGNGEFEIEDIRPGTWTVTAAAGHLGYGAEIVEVEVLERDTPEITIVIPPAQALLQQANVHFQANRFAEAREAFEKLLIALPANVALHQPIASSYQGEGNHAKALEHFDAFLSGMEQAGQAAVPQNAAMMTEVKAQAALSAAESGEFDRMHDYVDAIEDANFAAAADTLVAIGANTLSPAERFEETIELLDVVIDKVPSSPLAYYYRGMAHLQLEQDDQAKADLEKCVELSPTETAQVRQAKTVLEQMGSGS